MSGPGTEERYLGRTGTTRRQAVHWSCACGVHHAVEVLVSVDAAADPALARQLLDGGGAAAFTCPTLRERVEVRAPLVYHDPDNQLFVLVLDEGDRRRELHERAALLSELADDTTASVPPYVTGFAVVYGAAGLHRYVGEQAERAVRVVRRADSQPVVAPAAGDPWPGGRDPVVRRMGPDGAPVILVRAGRAEVELLTSDPLEVRVLVHRMPNYPLVTLVFGAPSSLAGRGGALPFFVPLDFNAEADRAVLAALGRAFDLTLEVYEREAGDRLARRRRISAPLADNARCAMSAAVDYQKRVPAAERSYPRALASFLTPDYDRLGQKAPLAAELDEGALEALERPADVARALRLVRRFSEPSAEDWLTLLRGYPVERWQARRRAVVERAVALGLWPGPVAAQVAVSEGMARSRKDLVVRLMRSFGNLLERDDHLLDDVVVSENWDALKEEASALGVPPAEWTTPRSEPIVSESMPVASGTIGDVTEVLPLIEAADMSVAEETRATVEPPRKASSNGSARRMDSLDGEQLLALLAERDKRMAAAIELARRGDPSGIGPVFGALDGMSRGEAGRVLGAVVGFGRSAEARLLGLLESRKGFLRQGAALALAMLHSEAGLEAICELVIDEPTEIWREVARALGETGAAGVMPLAARLQRKPEEARERVAWALAHIAARGARRPIETLAAGRDAVAAAVARHALELVESAKSDHLQVRSERAPRDQTVNRAFSRQFFAAMASDPAAPGGISPDLSGPAMLLDESDVLESMDVDGDEAELDEKDLIP